MKFNNLNSLPMSQIVISCVSYPALSQTACFLLFAFNRLWTGFSVPDRQLFIEPLSALAVQTRAWHCAWHTSQQYAFVGNSFPLMQKTKGKCLCPYSGSIWKSKTTRRGCFFLPEFYIHLKAHLNHNNALKVRATWLNKAQGDDCTISSPSQDSGSSISY